MCSQTSLPASLACLTRLMLHRPVISNTAGGYGRDEEMLRLQALASYISFKHSLQSPPPLLGITRLTVHAECFLLGLEFAILHIIILGCGGECYFDFILA